MTDWAARHAALSAATGDEWDRLNEAFETEWCVAYTAAFIDYAVWRGWSREDAESWPDSLVEEALFTAPDFDYDPQAAAKADVVICESEHE